MSPQPPPDELAARGRAIFERLRDRGGAAPSSPGPGSVPPSAPPPAPPPSGSDASSPDPTPTAVADEPPLPPEPPVESTEAPAVDLRETDGPPTRPLPRVMAIANQKGGVGKTTTAVNLGAGLADLGYRVLVIDLDPQGNASTGLGINIRDLQSSMYDVILNDVPLDDCIEATAVRNLFVAPASLDLAGAEIELVPAFSREMRLKNALAEVVDDYDFVHDRLPAVARAAHRERAGGGGRGAGPDPVRVLRAGGPGPAPEERGPRAEEPEPGDWS